MRDADVTARARWIPILWVVAFVVAWRFMIFGPLELMAGALEDLVPVSLLYVLAYAGVAVVVSISVALACRFGANPRWLRATFVALSIVQMVTLGLLLALEVSGRTAAELGEALGTAFLWSSMGILGAAVAFAFSRDASSFEQAHRAERQKVD